MRYSDQPRVQPKRVAERKTNREFFAEVAKHCDAERGRAAILLVGARDTRSLALRRAQAALRYDRRPSYFSHAALITRFRPEAPERSSGLEVTLDPESSHEQVPERNGVTRFSLRRYLDEERHPNLALVVLDLKDTKVPAPEGGKALVIAGTARKDEVLRAAQNPARGHELYPMWDALAEWARYAYSPEHVPNPLLHNVPLPSASLCEYAYATAEVDVVPGASDHRACPELLWATFLRWQQSLAPQVARIATYAVIRDEHAVPAAPLPMTLPL